MWQYLKQWLTAPVFPEDESKTRQARVLNSMLLALLIAGLLGTLLPACSVRAGSASFWFNVLLGLALLTFSLLLFWLMRHGHVRLASGALCALVLVSVVASMLAYGGSGHPGIFGLFVLIPIAGLLLGVDAATAVGVLSMASELLVYVLSTTGVVSTRLSPMPDWFNPLIMIMALLAMTYLLRTTLRAIDEGFARAYDNERQLQAALARLRLQQQALLDRIPEMVWLKDAKGRFTAVNTAFALTYGRAPEQVIGRRDDELVPAAAAARYAADDAEVMLTRQPKRSEGVVQNAKGEPMWTDTIKSPLCDDAGQVIGTIGMARDVTRQKQTEAALRVRLSIEELLTTLSTRFISVGPDELDSEIRRALEAIGRATAVDHCCIMLFSTNGALAERALEWWSDGLSPMPVGLMDAPTLTYWAMDQLRAGQTVHVPHVTDLPPEAEAGRALWSRLGVRSMVLIPILIGPTLVGFLDLHTERGERCWQEEDLRLLGLVRDMLANLLARTRTEVALRESEERLRQALKMEAVGMLAGGVAHDFNNLLTVILGNAELGLDEVPPTNRLYQMLENIHKSAWRAADLTHQLLAFSRRQLLQPRVLDLNALTVEFTKMLNRVIGENIELQLQLTPDLPPVFADPGALEQVLMNLTSNARDAMPTGGVLRIETAQASSESVDPRREAAPGLYNRVSVIDNGVGMDEGTLARIFEPFFTTKGVGKGTGLGLSAIYGIVRQHGGWIEVHSQPGKGTRFDVYLPATNPV